MKTAALYLRSSKDQAEVGTDIQRKELLAFAEHERLSVVDEFSDMELSGSYDEVTRPGFKKLLDSVVARKFDVVLAIDTSRIARDPMICMFFARECEKAGVEIKYSKIVIDSDTAMGEMMLGVLHQFDRLHARLSADKGRAGQEANLNRGYRAGGRPPMGYLLQQEETGAVRSGVPVRKTRLILNPELAPRVTAFLKSRAIGVSRTAAARSAGLGVATATLVGIEKNALTYSGALVWNRSRKHKSNRDDPRRTMIPRPRNEWIIVENQHSAVISRDEAERILAQVTHRPRVKRVSKPESALLTGLLVAPDGVPWHFDGNTKSYRCGKGKRVKADWLDGKVLFQIAHDSSRLEFVSSVVNEARRQAQLIEVDPQTVDRKLKNVEGKLRNLADAIAAGENSPTLRSRLAELEKERAALEREKGQCAQRAGLKAALNAISPDWVKTMLSLEALGISAVDGAARNKIRSRLATLLDRVTLNPGTRELTLTYRFTGAKMASPRGFEPRSPP